MDRRRRCCIGWLTAAGLEAWFFTSGGQAHEQSIHRPSLVLGMNTSAPSHADLPYDIHLLAAHVLGSQALAKQWLEQPAVALDGRCPGELLESEDGAQAVRELLMRIEFGVYD